MTLLPLISDVASAQGWQSKRSDTIWRGKIGSRDIVWSTSDVVVRAGRTRQFSLKTITENIFTQEMWEWSAQAMSSGVAMCDFARRGALLSVTDRYLGIRYDDERHCAGMPHPSAEARYATLDMDDSFRMVRLDEIFPPEDIRAALLDDDTVKKALAERGSARFEGTLDELVAQLGKFTESCDYMFPSDLLSRFVLYDVSAEKALVRLGLPHGCESVRGKLTDLTIALPVPASLAPSLRLASSRRSGYLMRDGALLAKERVAAIRVRLAVAPPAGK